MILIKIPFKVANKFNNSHLERLKTFKRILLRILMVSLTLKRTEMTPLPVFRENADLVR